MVRAIRIIAVFCAMFSFYHGFHVESNLLHDLIWAVNFTPYHALALMFIAFGAGAIITFFTCRNLTKTTIALFGFGLFMASGLRSQYSDYSDPTNFQQYDPVYGDATGAFAALILLFFVLLVLEIIYYFRQRKRRLLLLGGYPYAAAAGHSYGPQAGVIYCQRCGSPNTRGALYCQHCGSKIASTWTPTGTGHNNTASRAKGTGERGDGALGASSEIAAAHIGGEAAANKLRAEAVTNMRREVTAGAPRDTAADGARAVASVTPDAAANASHEMRRDTSPRRAATVVSLSGHYGGFWIRVLAAIIDGLVLLIPLAIASTAFKKSSFLVGMVLIWLYESLMLSSSAQATLGKMALGLRVTDMSGRRISFLRATGRHFAKYVSEILLMVGYMLVGWTKKKQGLHDMMASTLVTRKA